MLSQPKISSQSQSFSVPSSQKKKKGVHLLLIRHVAPVMRNGKCSKSINTHKVHASSLMIINKLFKIWEVANEVTGN